MAGFSRALLVSVALHGLLGGAFVLWPVASVTPRTPVVHGPMCCLIAADEPTPKQPLIGGPGQEGASLSFAALTALKTDVHSGGTLLPTSVGGVGPSKGGGVSFFKASAQGTRFVYVLDASASMSLGDGWTTACRELWASLHQLSAEARFQVIVYNNHAQFLLPRRPDWLPATPEILAEVLQALRARAVEGGTEHGPALRLALSLRPDVVFFLTDGDDRAAGHVLEAQRLNQVRAKIHTITLDARH